MKAIDILKHPVGAEFSTQYGRYIKFIPEHIQIVILKLELLEEQIQGLQSLLDLKQQEIYVLESKVLHKRSSEMTFDELRSACGLEKWETDGVQ